MKKLVLLSCVLVLAGCAEITHWAKTEPYVYDPSDPDYYMVPNREIIVLAPDQSPVVVEKVRETTVITSHD